MITGNNLQSIKSYHLALPKVMNIHGHLLSASDIYKATRICETKLYKINKHHLILGYPNLITLCE